jgi:hypothetical protein
VMPELPPVRNTAALSPDVDDLLACLNAQHVEFVLVGGYALGVHGVVRATIDIDLLYRASRENVTALCAALRQFGAPDSVISESALLDHDTVTQFGAPPNRVDLLNAIDGVDFDAVWATAVHAAFGAHRIRVIGRDALITNKRASGRDKDRQDIAMLEQQRPIR